jgi:predicted ATPase with chaperone activity
MHVTLGAVSPHALQDHSGGEASSRIRARVERSRDVQRKRYRRTPAVSCNAHASGRWLLAYGRVDADA